MLKNLTLSDWTLIAEISLSFATVITLTVGGIWTYFLFIRHRLNYPIVNLDIEPQSISLPNNKRLVHVQVVLKNIGKVILKSTEAEIRLRSVVPLPEEVEKDLNDGYDPVPEGKQEILWPMEVGRTWSWKSGEFEIEPGEDDILHSDFFIDQSISVVEFYFFIENEKKKTLGWQAVKIYEFENNGEENDK